MLTSKKHNSNNWIEKYTDGWTTEDLVFQWKHTDPVQVARNMHLPRFILEKFQTDLCNSITNTGKMIKKSYLFKSLYKFRSYTFSNYVVSRGANKHSTHVCIYLSWTKFIVKNQSSYPLVPSQVWWQETGLFLLVINDSIYQDVDQRDTHTLFRKAKRPTINKFMSQVFLRDDAINLKLLVINMPTLFAVIRAALDR